MPGGKPGDHPLSDILLHNLPVYDQTCDTLVRKLATFYSSYDLSELIDWPDNFSITPSQLQQLKLDLTNALDAVSK
jgi:hypothetical protein